MRCEALAVFDATAPQACRAWRCRVSLFYPDVATSSRRRQAGAGCLRACGHSGATPKVILDRFGAVKSACPWMRTRTARRGRRASRVVSMRPGHLRSSYPGVAGDSVLATYSEARVAVESGPPLLDVRYFGTCRPCDRDKTFGPRHPQGAPEKFFSSRTVVAAAKDSVWVME